MKTLKKNWALFLIVFLGLMLSKEALTGNVKWKESLKRTKTMVVNAATTADDYLLWRTPYKITIKNIRGVLLTGTNVVGGLDECDSAGANPVAVDSDITFDGGLDSDDGSLTNATIDAGDWIKWHTTTVSSPGYLTVTIDYTIY